MAHEIDDVGERRTEFRPLDGSGHAVVGLSESLYRELEGTGVSVHCLCPNLVRTKIFHSERNRDDGAAMRPSQTATMAPLREAISALGIPPDQVAGDIVDAMRANRFWIFTHDTTKRSLAVGYHWKSAPPTRL